MELVGQKILIVDDEPLFLQTTGQLLRKEGAECETAVDAGSALDALEKQEFDLILTDLNMPGNLRWELLKAGRERWSHVPMIVITGVPTLPSAIESLRLGVTDYLLKPVGFPELLASVRRGLVSGSKKSTGEGPHENIPARDRLELEEPLIGESPAMQELKAMIDRVASSNAHVLICGATGTGKELVARWIHRNSRRRLSPFLVVDCNATESQQLSTNLFGTAFPGQSPTSGLMEKVSGGCVFLDEVAELPEAFQPKLLRVIQNQQILPVGSQNSQPVDVRFISATQRKIESEIATGRFRQDLYYRLGVLSLSLPPLRERGEDILLLAEHFWKSASPSPNQPLKLDQSAKRALLDYHWPGNVRELRNAIHTAATFSSEGTITVAELPAEISQPSSLSQNSSVPREDSLIAAESEPAHFGMPIADASLTERRAEVEKAYLLELIESSRGNVTHAARKANMSRQGFHKLLKRHGLSASKFRD